MNNDKLKQEVRDEIHEMFNEIYVGVEMPYIDSKKVDLFVERALNRFEAKLFYEKKLKMKEDTKP